MAIPPNQTPAISTPRQGLARIMTGDRNAQLTQDNTQKAISALQGSPFTNGQVLMQTTTTNIGDKQNVSKLTLTTGQDNVFPHGLGRIPTFVLPFAPDAQSEIWVTASDKQSVTLRCSANCSVTVWVS